MKLESHLVQSSFELHSVQLVITVQAAQVGVLLQKL